MNISIIEAQYKALQYIAISPEEWINNLISSRAEEATKEIVRLFVDYAIANNITIPSNTDEIISLAYDLGIIKTAEERHAESISNMQSGI